MATEWQSALSDSCRDNLNSVKPAFFYALGKQIGLSKAKVYHAVREDTHEGIAVKKVKFQSVHDSVQANTTGVLTTSAALIADLEECVSRYKDIHALEHENLVKHLGLELQRKDENSFEIVILMEYCPGGTLFEKSSKVRGLGAAEVHKYACQVIKGLAYLHINGICHLDLKGHNVVLTADDKAKLCDLGEITKLKSVSRTGTNEVHDNKGTLHYMAPEMLNPDGSRRGRAADVYSFGCLLIEMMTGDFPQLMNKAGVFLRRQWDITFFVGNGGRPQIPRLDGFREKHYRMLNRCLDSFADYRPSVYQLANDLGVDNSQLVRPIKASPLDVKSNDYQTLLKTIYAEAGDTKEVQQAVAWVIKNRVEHNLSYFVGDTLADNKIASVCKRKGQFQCWSGVDEIDMDNAARRSAIEEWLPFIFQQYQDPTDGSEYFCRPDKEESYLFCEKYCDHKDTIGGYQFYKAKIHYLATDAKCCFNDHATLPLHKDSRDYRTLHRTVYAEARLATKKVQQAVSWVIKNRAGQNRAGFGGNTLADVCMHPHQFPCWNGQADIKMTEVVRSRDIDAWLPYVFMQTDPTNGSDYYHTPQTKLSASWTQLCKPTVKISEYEFYKSYDYLGHDILPPRTLPCTITVLLVIPDKNRQKNDLWWVRSFLHSWLARDKKIHPTEKTTTPPKDSKSSE